MQIVLQRLTTGHQLNGDTNETGTSANNAETTRFATAASTGDYCILQGDVITVEYTDQNDASGNSAVSL